MADIWADVPTNLKEKFPAEAVFSNPKRVAKTNLYSVCIYYGKEHTPSFKAYIAIIEKRTRDRWILPSKLPI